MNSRKNNRIEVKDKLKKRKIIKKSLASRYNLKSGK